MKKTLSGAVLTLLSVVLVLTLMVPTAFAGKYEAIEGVKTANAIFDFRMGDPGSAALHLDLIHQTLNDLKVEKKSAKFVVVFIGPSLKLISTNREGFTPENKKHLEGIAQTVTKMSKDGIKLELCGVAAELLKVDLESILPEIKHVRNGWVSVVGYQAKGYNLVPVF